MLQLLEQCLISSFSISFPTLAHGTFFLSFVPLSVVAIMPPKDKDPKENINPLIFPPLDLHHIAMADIYYQIYETHSDIDIIEMYFWLEEKWIVKFDEIQLWECNLPYFIFPPTHSAPNFIRKCHASYLPSQRAIVNYNGQVMFTITP